MVYKCLNLTGDGLGNSAFEKSGYDSAIGISRFLMRACGIWPKFGASKATLGQFSFVFFTLMMLSFVNIPQTVQAYRVFGDMNEFLNVLTLGNMPIAMNVLKMVNARFHRNELQVLIFTMSEDWERPSSIWERKIMWTQVKLSRLISITMMGLAFCTISSYTVRNLYLPKIDGNRQMFFSAVFPWNSIASPGYEYTWFLQFVAIIVSGFAFMSVDTAFVALVLHLRGQLINLQLCFRNIGKLEFDNSIEELIQRHHRIIKFAGIMENSFNLMFLLQMFTSIILLVLQSYLTVTTLSGEMSKDVLVNMPFMIYFTTTYTSSVFMYCYAAETIRSESSLLGNAVFECGWYDIPMKEKKLLIFLLTRMRKPLEFTAGKFFVMSLTLFCNIVKSSASYVTVLLAKQNN